MPSLLYPDCLDTVRNDLAPEPSIMTIAQVKMHLVLGYTLNLSQTQSFDSVHVLEYAKNAAFCDLVRNGAIRIVLRRGARGLADAFAGRVSDLDFHLCAWPEIEHSLDDATHQPDHRLRSEVAPQIVEAASGRCPLRGSGSLEARWDQLLTLDAAYREAGEHAHSFWDPTGSQPSSTLEDEIVAARDGESVGTELHYGLTRLVELGGNQRSAYYRHIHNDLHDVSPGTKADLHSMVNLSYNCVVAQSLRSQPGLSADSPAAIRNVGARMDSMSASESPHVIELEQLNTGNLEHLSWQTVLDLRKIMQHESWSAETKWDKLKEYSAVAVSEVLLADKTALRVVSIVPAAADALISAGLNHAAGALLSGPDTSVLSALFYYQLKEDWLDPAKWLQKRILESYERKHKNAIIALLGKGLGRAHYVTRGAHA